MSYYTPAENKYPQIPEQIIDLHGYTTSESKEILDEIFNDKEVGHVRIIVGRGLNSSTGPVLPSFVKNYLNSNQINFHQAKIQDGGEGALEVFFNS